GDEARRGKGWTGRPQCSRSVRVQGISLCRITGHPPLNWGQLVRDVTTRKIDSIMLSADSTRLPQARDDWAFGVQSISATGIVGLDFVPQRSTGDRADRIARDILGKVNLFLNPLW